jgi:hypothetical protein
MIILANGMYFISKSITYNMLHIKCRKSITFMLRDTSLNQHRQKIPGVHLRSMYISVQVCGIYTVETTPDPQGNP